MQGLTRPAVTRLDTLDAVRGLAVAMVFAAHATEVFARVTTKQPWLARSVYDLNLGRVGVVAFFAVSGFLIPSSLHGRTGPGLARFAIGRVFRLYPAYILSVPASAATYGLMTQGLHLGLGDGLLNLTMIPRLFAAPMANGAYWTLEVELAFYVLCAYLFWGGALANAFALASLMLALFGVFYSSQTELLGGLLNPSLSGETFLLCLHLACMLWGAVVRHLWDGKPLGPAAWCAFALFTAYWLGYMPTLYALHAAGWGGSALDARLIAGYSTGLWLFLAGVGGCQVVAGTGVWNAAGLAVLRAGARVVIWFGRISYSFYLLHQAGFYAVYDLVLDRPGLQHRSMPYYLLAALLVSTVLASVSYYLVERPGIRLGRRLVRAAGFGPRPLDGSAALGHNVALRAPGVPTT